MSSICYISNYYSILYSIIDILYYLHYILHNFNRILHQSFILDILFPPELELTQDEQDRKDLFDLFNELDEDRDVGFWEIVEEVGLFNYLWFWRSAARRRRLHYIMKDYERKIKRIDTENKEKIEADLAASER